MKIYHIRTAKVGKSVLSLQLNTTNHPLYIGQKSEKVAKMPISALFSLTDGFLMILAILMITAGIYTSNCSFLATMLFLYKMVHLSFCQAIYPSSCHTLIFSAGYEPFLQSLF